MSFSNNFIIATASRSFYTVHGPFHIIYASNGANRGTFEYSSNYTSGTVYVYRGFYRSTFEMPDDNSVFFALTKPEFKSVELYYINITLTSSYYTPVRIMIITPETSFGI